MNVILSSKRDPKLGIYTKRDQNLSTLTKEVPTHPEPYTPYRQKSDERPCETHFSNIRISIKRVDFVYHSHANFPTMGDLWQYMDKKEDCDKENDPTAEKLEQKCLFLY